MTEMSRYNLGVTFFKTLIARSYLINFLITGGFLWLACTVCYSQLNLTSATDRGSIVVYRLTNYVIFVNRSPNVVVSFVGRII